MSGGAAEAVSVAFGRNGLLQSMASGDAAAASAQKGGGASVGGGGWWCVGVVVCGGGGSGGCHQDFFDVSVIYLFGGSRAADRCAGGQFIFH